MTGTNGRVHLRGPAWSHPVLAAILVPLIGGAFWLETRPRPAATTAAPSRESTEALLALGIRRHNAQGYDSALKAYRQVLLRDPNHPQAQTRLGAFLFLG